MSEAKELNQFDLGFTLSNGDVVTIDGYKTIQTTAFGILFDLTKNSDFISFDMKGKSVCFTADSVIYLEAIPSESEGEGQ